jgi:membrane-associated phospholipid phosphatase
LQDQAQPELGYQRPYILFAGRTKLVVVALAIAAFGLCLLPVVLVGHAKLDLDLLLGLNTLAARSRLFDTAVANIAQTDLLGVGLLGLIWACWFDDARRIGRERILVGAVAALAGGIVSRGLQLVLPTHNRPLHNGAEGFILPFGIDPTVLNGWNSFPSDHAAVYFGLTFVILAASPWMGLLALALAVINSLTRVYMGIHFPSDVLGGALVGLVVVQLAWARPLERVAGWVTAFSTARPPLFYFLAFVGSYCIATLGWEIRKILGAFVHYLAGG